ncbi:hypothetical protein FBU30_010222 [Linnemannia zychae]|nr:hypothetical protein FBU30_010222 [Linnemannia zychae]
MSDVPILFDFILAHIIMQFKALVLFCGLLGFAAANPISCNASGQKQVCCDGLLSCLVQVLGDNCSTQAYCCTTNAAVGGIISINALNCVKLL